MDNKKQAKKDISRKPKVKRKNFSLWIFLIIIGVFFMFQVLFQIKPENKIPYSEFKSLVASQRIKDVTIYPEKIIGKLDDNSEFSTIPINDLGLVSALDKNGITYRGVKENKFAQFLFTWIVPIGLMVMIWIFITRQMDKTGSSVLSFGKTRAKIYAEKNTKTTFNDVAGCKEAKEELQEIIEYLKSPEKFQTLGGKIPRGVLLVGLPGTGKTLLARAVAGEASVPFFSISGSDFVEMFVGVGASRVRDLFVQAKAKSPCLVFIDEIDAVGRQRGAGLGGGHDEREQTLNQLLVEMDGFEVNSSVIIIAATNRPDVLDAALLRPGRFDRQVVIDTPDVKEREAIIKVHLRGKPLNKDVSTEVLAQRTPGFSGADLANAVNEAALLAARRSKKKIDMLDFEEAIDRVVAGPERRSKIISDEEKKNVAYHEAGHALVRYNCPNADPVHKISIIPRGFGALGFTMHLPAEDRHIISARKLKEDLSTMMGGRVAEEIVFGELSTGAQNDIERATSIARKMVCNYGMSKALGPLSYGTPEHQVFLGKYITSDDKNFSEQTAKEIDLEIRRIIDESYQSAFKIISSQRDKLDLIAEQLLVVEVMEKEEFNALMEGREYNNRKTRTAKNFSADKFADDNASTKSAKKESETDKQLVTDIKEQAEKVSDKESKAKKPKVFKKQTAKNLSDKKDKKA
ncbi:ATP-dependent zinc metalloprotease FtsH [bacterium]|nr:ATP-dependent zinc metalloprotease FtsH [bacterium]